MKLSKLYQDEDEDENEFESQRKKRREKKKKEQQEEDENNQDVLNQFNGHTMQQSSVMPDQGPTEYGDMKQYANLDRA